MIIINSAKKLNGEITLNFIYWYLRKLNKSHIYGNVVHVSNRYITTEENVHFLKSTENNWIINFVIDAAREAGEYEWIAHDKYMELKIFQDPLAEELTWMLEGMEAISSGFDYELNQDFQDLVSNVYQSKAKK